MATFRDILAELYKVAQEDGKLSQDEYEIIKQVEVDLELFNRALAAAEEDRMLEPEEIGTLMDLRDRILERAEIVARADGSISDDEIRLLGTLAQVLKKLV